VRLFGNRVAKLGVMMRHLQLQDGVYEHAAPALSVTERTTQGVLEKRMYGVTGWQRLATPDARPNAVSM
jgi:hypothetical protein